MAMGRDGWIVIGSTEWLRETRRPWWRRHVRTLAVYGAFVALFAVNAGYAESRARVRDAVQLRDSAEARALLTWVALQADSR